MIPGLLVAVVLLAALAGYWWWQHTPLTPGTIRRRAPFLTLMSLRKTTVFVATALVLAACLGTVYLVRAHWPTRKPKTAQAMTTPPPTRAPSAAFLQKFPKEYASAASPPVDASKPLPPKGVPVAPAPAPAVAYAPPSGQSERSAAPPSPPLSKAEMEALIAKAVAQNMADQQAAIQRAIEAGLAQQARTTGAAQGGLGAGTTAQPGVPKAADGPRRWYTTKPGGEAGGDGEDRQAGSAPPDKKAAPPSKLFPQATWERPANPLRVIYSSQLLQGLLEQNVVTGESSTVRLRLTQTLYDKFGQGVPLLPLDSLVLAVAEGTVKRGQTRVRMQVTKIELPDGTDLELVGKVGDAGGAVGMKGKVDHKYGQVILATMLSTALSVGARVAGGNSDSYQPTIQQEFARDASSGFNQAGQQVVKDALNVQAEIFLKAHDPATIQLDHNISLQTAPVIVRK